MPRMELIQRIIRMPEKKHTEPFEEWKQSNQARKKYKRGHTHTHTHTHKHQSAG